MQHNVPISNTFNFAVFARSFVAASTPQELLALANDADFAGQRRLVVGGGSNLLFLRDFDGCVVHPTMPNIELLRETGRSVWLRVGAGVLWDELVQHSVSSGWGGLENLSLIPGCVGAAPVQNVGAYGAEAKDCIAEVEYVDFADFTLKALPREGCGFGYRSSIFKRELKNRACITHVTFCLSCTPQLNTSYGQLGELVESLGGLSLRNLREAIVRTRRSKLPDPAELGNAGSFFKNPVVQKSLADTLQSAHPNMPSYAAEGGVKIPAAWLIEQAGFKGARRGSAGVHAVQPLVLLNLGGSSGAEVLALAHEICDAVRSKFGITLDMEVNVVE
ncbi:MAG: UDP-N-acetylmuramate dehydrogenase [Prevotellaceae bacterium]|jgi:UDP-N-acetylmuramate dehydrogenase|nr:UDP-N-acetylmuramate dehydrogenase [Prevotellaceae bacterium]